MERIALAVLGWPSPAQIRLFNSVMGDRTLCRSRGNLKRGEDLGLFLYIRGGVLWGLPLRRGRYANQACKIGRE